MLASKHIGALNDRSSHWLELAAAAAGWPRGAAVGFASLLAPRALRFSADQVRKAARLLSGRTLAVGGGLRGEKDEEGEGEEGTEEQLPVFLLGEAARPSLQEALRRAYPAHLVAVSFDARVEGPRPERWRRCPNT